MKLWRIMVPILALSACSSSDDEPGIDSAVPQYQLTTEWLGLDLSLGLSDDAVQLVNTATTNDQKWLIEPLEGGYFRIANIQVGSGQSLDIVNDGVFDNVVLAPTGDFSGQRWLITPLDNGYCRLTTDFLGPDYSLDIKNDELDRIVTMAVSGMFNGQNWRIENISDVASDETVPLCAGPA
ncbi:MAG: RICIN domain-containing protein [Granulosicoccus sp.]